MREERERKSKIWRKDGMDISARYGSRVLDISLGTTGAYLLLVVYSTNNALLIPQ